MIQKVLIVRATRLIAQDEAFDEPVELEKDELRNDRINDTINVTHSPT